MNELDVLYELDPAGSEVLYAGSGAEVRQYRNYRWLNLDGSLIQSVMDCNQPQRLINPVNIYMLLALSCVSTPRHVLNFGLGGGVFERFFTHYYPGATLDPVESNELVIHLARGFFAVDPAMPVYLQSAGEFIVDVDRTYDLILCDIFQGEILPECLYSEDFYAGCGSCLNRKGMMVLNLVPEDEQDMVNLLLPLRRVFEHTALLDIPEHDNIVVYAAHNDIKCLYEPELPEAIVSLPGFDIQTVSSCLRLLPAVNS